MDGSQGNISHEFRCRRSKYCKHIFAPIFVRLIQSESFSAAKHVPTSGLMRSLYLKFEHVIVYIICITMSSQPICDMVSSFNSLAPERCGRSDCKTQFTSVLITSCETGLRQVPQNPIDNKSTLVQVMAWCHQAPSHYLSQCWNQIYVAIWHH